MKYNQNPLTDLKEAIETEIKKKIPKKTNIKLRK